MRITLMLLCHVAILLAAIRCTHSTSGFLVTGPGLCVLIDQFAFRRRPGWKRDAGVGLGFFLLGAVASYVMRPGIVPVWEAAYRGAVVGVVVVSVEALARATAQAWVVRVAAVGVVVVLAPVIGGLHPLHTVPKRSPAAFGLAFEDIRFRTSDGVELGGWFMPHPRPRGNVIFCHGHGRNRGHVAGVLTTLHDLGLNVLAFDFRGHGESGGHTSTFGRREVQDLLAAEAYLRGRCPEQPLFLVGVSLGAAVSLQTLPELTNVRGVWSEGAFACLGHAVEHNFARVPPPLRAPLVQGYYVLGWLDCGLWGASVSPLDGLRGAGVPIFFCHGMNDELVPLPEGVALFNAYGGPKEHWWVADASHYNVRQRNHEEYPRRLRVFIEDCLRLATD